MPERRDRAVGQATPGDLAETAKLVEDLDRRMRGRRRRVTHGWDALTPTELSVARAVAAGHANTQVAERLYVAPSTVKTHLERIYAKVGISGWAALATELTRQESTRG